MYNIIFSDPVKIYQCNEISAGASSQKIKPLNVKLSIFHHINCICGVANTAQLVKLGSMSLFGETTEKVCGTEFEDFVKKNPNKIRG